MPEFLCDYLNEIVILSDGCVTTCCLDPLAVNVFGNIHEDSLPLIQNRFLAIREKVAKDVCAMPRCRICYEKLKAAGFPKTGTYKIDPADQEMGTFLEKGIESIKRMVIEPTCLCNLKCNGCMQSREDIPRFRKNNRLNLPGLLTWIGSGIAYLTNIRFYNYGETFLHPQAIHFCAAVKNLNPKANISIATNGMLLNTPERRGKLVASGVDELIFSIHGASQKAVAFYMTRRFDFEKIVEILIDLVRIRKDEKRSSPRLIWRYLLFSWNDSYEEIERAIFLSRHIGMDRIAFDTVGFPSPSTRLTPGSDALKELRNRLNE